MLVYPFDLELIFDIGNNVDISKVVIYIEKKMEKIFLFYITTEGNDSNSVRKTMRNGDFACLLIIRNKLVSMNDC